MVRATDRQKALFAIPLVFHRRHCGLQVPHRLGDDRRRRLLRARRHHRDQRECALSHRRAGTPRLVPPRATGKSAKMRRAPPGWGLLCRKLVVVTTVARLGTAAPASIFI